MEPHPSQQHSGPQNAAVVLIQNILTMPKVRFKQTSPEKSEVDGSNLVPTYLGQSLHLYSPW